MRRMFRKERKRGLGGGGPSGGGVVGERAAGALESRFPGAADVTAVGGAPGGQALARRGGRGVAVLPWRWAEESAPDLSVKKEAVKLQLSCEPASVV